MKFLLGKLIRLGSVTGSWVLNLLENWHLYSCREQQRQDGIILKVIALGSTYDPSIVYAVAVLVRVVLTSILNVRGNGSSQC